MEWNDEDFADLFAYEADKCASELKRISAVYRKYGKNKLADEVAEVVSDFETVVKVESTDENQAA